MLKFAPIVLLPLLLAGCNWVDSTGRQDNAVPETEVLLDDVAASGAIALDERTIANLRVSATDADGIVQSWRWSDQPESEGRLPACDGVGDFDAANAADSLQAACASTDDCRIVFDEQPSATPGVVEFRLQPPELRTSVGLVYSLAVTDNDGASSQDAYTFCLASVNQPPVAVDDSFVMQEGQVLQVTAAGINLLSNDSDDIDVRNEPLRVRTQAVRAPAAASLFELRDDGGFTYAFAGTRLQQNIVDTFEYAVTDGSLTSTAEVSITIVAERVPVEQVANVPALVLVAGIPFTIDLGEYFDDPLGGALAFGTRDIALPLSGEVSLSATGVLGGTATEGDIGRYAVPVTVSNGVSDITTLIDLQVIDNLPIATTAIPVQRLDVGDSLALDTSVYFSDPEGQPIAFSLVTAGSAPNLTINSRTGVVSGFASAAGDHAVTVIADDGYNTPARQGFILRVSRVNSAPTFSGSIADQVVTLGDAITTIRPDFRDADGDSLTYTVAGQLPPGVRLSSDGRLSGKPTATGVYAGLRIIASDPAGLSAGSNAFRLTVVAANPDDEDEDTDGTPVNTAPRYLGGAVFNQGIILGNPITPVVPEFVDDEGDTLSYRITGNTLPPGISIDTATGAVSGVPVSRTWVRDLQVEAVDPGGLSATSTSFWIRVR